MAHLWSEVWRGSPKTPPRTQIRRGHFVNEYNATSVEPTGFESLAPSLRKMQSKPFDQGKRTPWRLGGAAVGRAVRRGET